MNLSTSWKENILNTFQKKRISEAKSTGYRRIFVLTLLISLFLLSAINSIGQTRNMEYLARGLVAVNTTDYVFVSWRIFATDGDSVQFNLYRNGTLVNETPISSLSNYADTSGSANSIYYLETLYNSGKTEISNPVDVWKDEYKSIHLQLPGDNYYPNDASASDLDGDGEMELIVKVQMANPDNTGTGGKLDPVYLQAYKLNNKIMWSINLGVNIRAGSHYTQFMVYDLNNDGIAEVACKTAPGTMDGTGEYLSKGPAATDNDADDYRDANGMILTGPEYLTVFDGLTGKEISTVEYIPVRGEDMTGWGDTWGNRVDRFLAGVAYFDSNPSLVYSRGYYRGDNGGSTGTRGKTVIATWDLVNDSLVNRWTFNADYTGENPSYTGQGNHNLSVADVDNDGKDEIIYGSMAVDHDGSPLWNSGLGHGDALHVSDIDPERPGLEVWGIHEHAQVGSALLDAATGEIIWGTPEGDVARGVSADIDSTHIGMECWAGPVQVRSSKNEYVGGWPSSSNFVIWWDGDLLRELLDGVTISKYNGSGDIDLFTAEDCMSNNGTKSTPTLSGDILGDWREEVIFKTMDDQELRIFTTTTPSKYGLYTLLQDPQYRVAIAWQNSGYNQPPHPGFYLGHGMDLDSLPVPDISVHKNENNSSIYITSPSNGFELGLGSNLDITIGASGISESNTKIVISNGDTPLDTIESAPYYTSIPGLTTGDYFLMASAFDKNGVQIVSDTIHISVDEGYPHVSITAPEEGTTYLPEDSIAIAAHAYDTDGNIDSIAFFLNDIRISSFTASPYSLKIENPGIGIHALKAVAYDNDGKSTESDILYLEVGLSTTIQEEETGFCGFNNGEGWIESNNVGYTGTGFANTDNVPGVQVVWAIDFPEAGTYKFEIRYACSESRPGKLLIGGEELANVNFESTVDYTTWYTIAVNASAPAGIQEVVLEANHGNGSPNIDYLKIYSLESSQVAVGVHCDSLIPSNDASLLSLSVAEAAMVPSFSSANLNYNIVLSDDISEINISAELSDPNASIVYDSIVTVLEPSGAATIEVTSRDGSVTQTYTINYEYLTSVNELSILEPNIYPVPADKYLNIQLQNNAEIIEEISVYSVEGRKIITEKMMNENRLKLELPEFQNGIYLILVRTNLDMYRVKFNVVNR